MKARILFALLGATLLASCTGGMGTGPGSGSSAGLNFDYLINHWVHSYEEEGADGVLIYRPADFKEFPPSHFRMQYIFYKNLDCDWFYLAPDDGHHFRKGTWRRDLPEKDVIHIDQDGQTVSYRILELTPTLLRMEMRP